MLKSAIIYYHPIIPDCRKCKRGIPDGEGHTFCTAIGEWGDDTEQDGTCRFFKERKHRKAKKCQSKSI